jgi:NAD(P)-dependent dehydrogenase (short-subunit alcohol dehydrogenase family)
MPHIWGLMGQLDGKVVLVSGGASDIGRATALRLAAQEGAAVVIGRRALEGAGRWPRRSPAPGGAHRPLCDVRSEESVAAFVERAVAEFGTASTAVDHNAAWSHPAPRYRRRRRRPRRLGPGHRDHDARRIAPGAPRHPRHGGGRRGVHRHHLVGNEHHRRVDPGGLRRVQGGLNQLTRHLATRYGRDGIRANAIAPGFILTETAETQVPEDIRRAWPRPTRPAASVAPDDIARVVVFLCSDAAAYVNGQVLHVDGGHQIAGMM